MRSALSWFPLILAAGILCLDALAAQAPATTQAASSEAVLRRFAGVWKEEVDNRKSGAFSLLLRFRRSAAGGLEELRGPEDRPRVRPVVPDGGLRPIPGSKNSIRWKQIDPNRFEAELFGPGQKLLAPATGNFANTMVAARQLDEHAMEFSHSRDGSVFLKTTLRISPDGKTMTVSGVSVGPDGPRGEPRVTVYQKQ